MKWLCKIGIHAFTWQSRKFDHRDLFPAPGQPWYSTPERICRRCGLHQEWRPGAGGTELGQWVKAEKNETVS